MAWPGTRSCAPDGCSSAAGSGGRSRLGLARVAGGGAGAAAAAAVQTASIGRRPRPPGLDDGTGAGRPAAGRLRGGGTAPISSPQEPGGRSPASHCSARRGSFVADMIGSTLLVSTDGHGFRGSEARTVVPMRPAPPVSGSIGRYRSPTLWVVPTAPAGAESRGRIIRAIVKVSRSMAEDWPDRRLPRAVRP